VGLAGLPIGGLSWAAINALSLYIFLFTDLSPRARRRALVLLAVTVPMLWSRMILDFFATSILDIDAALVGWLIGTEGIGNMIRFADSQDFLLVFPECSSLPNMSLAFVCWIAVTQTIRHRWSSIDLVWSCMHPKLALHRG
jgi:hypothetical protein